VFVSFVHSCIARVAGLLSDLAVCQTKTRDYCLLVAAACLRPGLHSTCVCVYRLMLLGRAAPVVNARLPLTDACAHGLRGLWPEAEDRHRQHRHRIVCTIHMQVGAERSGADTCT